MKNTNPTREALYCKCLTLLFLGCLFLGTPIAANAGNEINNHNPFAVSFDVQPVNTTVCETGNTSFFLTATGTGTLSYQWQISTNGGVSYSNITPSAVYSNVTTATLQITGAAFIMNNYRYQCIVTDNSGSTSSAAAILTVNPAPQVQTGNDAKTVCSNGGTSLTAQFFATHTYQWQVSTNNGANWNNITDGGSYAGAATDELVISSPGALNGNLYRYVATLASGCQAFSGVDTLHVLQPVIATQPTAATICAGSPATFTVAATSPTVLTYQWQLGAVNISNNATYNGVTTNTLTVNATAAMDRQLYRVVVRDTLPCTTNSSQVRLFVLTAPSINTQPQNVSTCAGLTATFTVSATAGTTSAITALTYQWQTDNGSNGTTWSNITPGGTTATLSLAGVTMAMSGYRYRVQVSTGACGTVTSSEGTLSVRSSGTWLGAVDTNWHIAGNWCGGVPVSTTDVLIPNWAPRMPTISNTTGIAYSRSLTIEDNAKLTINGGSTSMSGPFDIEGTVAYTAIVNQPILPADHGSLEIDGSGNKLLQVTTGVYHNVVLGGTAKLVTGTRILIMKSGSNEIVSNAPIGTPATSWIVTGTGDPGAANTGLGGLRFEGLSAGRGIATCVIGPTSMDYNPCRMTNLGATDDFTVSVNDQPIPGAMVDVSIHRTWMISEAVPGGSDMVLQLQWNESEEQSSFARTACEILRSDGTSIVQRSATHVASGSNPYLRGEGFYTALSLFSVATYATGFVLPVNLLSFKVKQQNETSASILWETDKGDPDVSYVVERSEDRLHFAAIGTVRGESGTRFYEFTDNNAGNRNSIWYRLHVIPTESKSFYSRIVQLTNNNPRVRVNVRPSLTNKDLTTLFISLSQKENMQITILDIMGRVYWQQTARLAKGEHSLPLQIGSLSKGIYYVQVEGDSGTRQVLSLVKQ